MIGWSNRPIGIDIENSNRKIKSNKVFKKILHNSELKNINFKNKNHEIKRLLKIWVIKEAIVKKMAQSLIRDSKEWEWITNKNMALNTKENKKINLIQETLYRWEIGIECNALEDNFPIICFDNI